MFARKIVSVQSATPERTVDHLSLVHFEGQEFGTYLYDKDLAVAKFLDEQLDTEAGRAALDLLERFEELVVEREHDRHERDSYD